MTRPYDEVMAPLRGGVDPEVASLVAADAEAAYDLVFGLGDAVAARRAELQLSQTELAQAAGIPQADISRIEHGKGNPTLATLVKLFTALDLTVTIAAGRIRTTH